MPPVELMLVGCGLMGARHVRGYGELERVRPGSLKLIAVCDPRREARAAVADVAEQLLGERPAEFASAQQALDAGLSPVAADVVTHNRSHDEVVVELLEAGLHVQVEKPIAVTIERARRMLAAASRSGRRLAVAENNRRDPMNRLLQHVVASGLIGRPYFAVEASMPSQRGVIGTPWRHSLAQGGVLLDVGIHLAYGLEMALGPIAEVSAVGQQLWRRRNWRGPDGRESEVEVEGDDCFAATLTFESGVHGVWMTVFGATGPAPTPRTVYGTEGAVQHFGDRRGRPLLVQRGGESLEGAAVVASVPDWQLSDIEALLFGDRPHEFRLESAETDRKLIAAETADFVDAIRNERPPEVTGEVGLRALAVIHAIHESVHAGASVCVGDVLAGRVRSFQDQCIESARAGSV